MVGYSPRWVELSVDAQREAVDWVGMVLASAGFTGEPLVEEQSAEPLPIRVRWRVSQVDAGRMLAKLQDGLAPLQRTGLIGELHTRPVDETSEEQIHVAPVRVGRRFVVLHPNANYVPQHDDVLLWLHPTLAFGTGLHPATRLTLLMVDRYAAPGVSALDLGCGSGIASLALARLGAKVLALDNDPAAVVATRENVRLNDLEALITVEAGSLPSGAELGHWLGWSDAEVEQVAVQASGFDLIVANILARIHLRLAEDYRRALRPSHKRGALLITSGYQTDYAEEVDTALQDVGFEPLDREQEDDWVALVHRLI